MNHPEYLSFISQFLPQPRIDHSLRVAQSACQLARHYGINPDQAEIAGILHDVAKYLSPDECRKQALPICTDTNAVWGEFPLIWHQFAGADIVAAHFPRLPDTIISAIRWHTTGMADMERLVQIIFLADYIEPHRTFETRSIVEKLAYKNLDQAAYALALLSLQDLIHRQIPIFPKSIECYNFYLSKIGKKDAKVVDHLLHSTQLEMNP